MKRIYLKDLETHLNHEITLQGFVDNIRDLQYVQFIILRDITEKVQITIEKNEENKKLNEIVSNLTNESTIKVVGRLLANSKVKLRGMELLPSEIIVTSKSLEELPFNFKNNDTALIDTKLDYRFIDLRNEKNTLIFKIQSCMIEAMRSYLYQENFIEINTPKIIGTASESGSEVFELKYFNQKAYLAQSPQFYKQMAMASGLEKIFEVAPAFRAENSNTNRHATEFTSFDLEFSYINSFEDVMSFEEDLLIAGFTAVKNQYGEQIKTLFNKEVIIPTKPFPRLKLNEVYQALADNYGYQIPKEDAGDLNSEAEKLTGKLALKKYGHEFIFITDYSFKKRPFYHMRKEGVPQGYDLIWRGCEITTGAQREHRYEILKKQAQEKGLDKDVKFYLEFFKYGCPPHGGFGLGVNRLTMLMLGITIKEAMFIFRGPNRLNP
ncbi:MAG: aspartate--tRNA(Asn) ligase [Tenericutes bacterium]|jgi:aspartyl-tRNA synthetase|nr:aspartate--tRNA(Asn) ligase [Mycoplasmatota bacterium]